jgi:putative ABC transport system permease protein
MRLFDELREGLGISWDAIRANKMRSILTTLGIVIGIVTVTLMGTAIEGLDRAFIRSISALGANVFYVSQTSWFIDSREEWLKSRKRRELNLSEIEALPARLELSRAVAPTANNGVSVKYKDRSATGVWAVGTTEEYLQTSGLTVAEGRFFTAADVEGGRPVCVIGSELSTNLFRGESPLGCRLRVADRSFEVIGVLDKQGSFLGMFSLDNRVVLPLKQFIGYVSRNPDLSIEVKATQLANLDEAREELRQAMRHIRQLAPDEADDFSINQQEQFITIFHQQTRVIALIGLCITALSLFVGGIGIMNIMFVSVAERTREIGVRKALGARRRTILFQFLVEAACLCLMGGMIGLGIAWLLTFGVDRFLPTAMPPTLVGIALLVSLVTGLVSGFLPAWRAARMDPVEALRSE